MDKFEWISRQLEVRNLIMQPTKYATFSYAYTPSEESLMAGDPSQDYLAFYENGPEIGFVLCDGVSMSYRGDFGARILGERLFHWLKQQFVNEKNASDRLNTVLLRTSQEASDSLKELQLPSHLPPLLVDVLGEKRDKGTEAMYICGNILLPWGQRPGKLWVVWQGDARLRVWLDGIEREVAPPAMFATSERWSSRQGAALGIPHVYETELDSGTGGGVMIYSDGFSNLDPYQLPLNGERLSFAVKQALGEGPQDDATLLQITWK